MIGEFCPKTYFATEADADFYIKKLKATSNRSKVPKYAYLCPDCFNWHLTSQEKQLDVITKYRQKINKLGKLLAEKDIIINELKKKKIPIDVKNEQVQKFNNKYINLNK